MKRQASALEDEVMAIVWQRGSATAADVLAGLARPRSNATVRTILRRLEEKGYLRHRLDGRAFVYVPRVAESDVAGNALQRVMRRFFGGSASNLVARLLDDGVIDAREVARLSKRIQRLRRHD